MKNPYGLKNGQFVEVDEVERGLACGCICPGCGNRLEAHKGEQRQYFQHDDGGECSHAYQTALHMLAKEVLLEEKRLLLPPLSIYPSSSLGKLFWRKRFERPIVKRNTIVVADDVRLEKKLGDIIPDVVFYVGNRALMIEIYVTHKIDDEKQNKIKQQLDISTIEFDLSQIDRTITKDDLRKILITGESQVGHGLWIHYRGITTVQAALDTEFKAQLPRLQAEEDRRAAAKRQAWQKKLDIEAHERQKKLDIEAHEKWEEQKRLDDERQRKEGLF
ncbi:MAG: hypothetical protein H7062_17385 [Candidatus Saccharimonas sp.]|nr:hypothetical protein [Planctomycetaceae bacterium]